MTTASESRKNGFNSDIRLGSARKKRPISETVCCQIYEALNPRHGVECKYAYCMCRVTWVQGLTPLEQPLS